MVPSFFFLSYSRKQFYIAERVASTLSQRGLVTWFDVQRIYPGTDWQGSIDEGLANCQALVVLGSRAASRSGPVRYEIEAARKAGKPIYLLAIEDSPLVAALRDVATVIDCGSSFGTGINTLAKALESGAKPAQPYHRRNPLSLRIPFGAVKYLQLLSINLAFLLGSADLVLRKQIKITGPLTPRLAPALALASIPVLMWLFGFAYSLILLIAYRRQRGATYFALEFWPAVMVFAFPALLSILDTLSTQDSGTPPDSRFGLYFNGHFAVIDRAYGDPTLPWQLLCFFAAWGIYLAFVTLTLRGWLLMAGWLPLIALYTIPTIPTPIRLIGFLLVSGTIVFLCARRFLSGHDISVAFGERLARFDTSGMATVFTRGQPLNRISDAGLAWAMWLSPGSFPQDLIVRHQAQQSPAPLVGVKTWRVHHIAADRRCMRAVRKVLAAQPGLREVTDEGASFQIALLSNKTPRAWIAALSARYPQLICIMVSSVDVDSLGLSLQQLQWIDYRQQQKGQLHYLARALAGAEEVGNPTVPENFARPLGPYPVSMLTVALRLAGVAILVFAASSLLLMTQLHAAIAPPWLIAVSLALGVWAWWVAERLMARTAYLTELLLTFGALIAALVAWVRLAGVALLPREVWVHNGEYNGALTSGVTFAGLFVVVPAAGFLLVACAELLRKVGVLYRWLPVARWPRWSRTLAVPFWRQIGVSYLAYPAVGVALVATVLLTSPFQHPQVHEFDLPTTDLSPESLLAGPDGNIWFALSGMSSYSVGSISPAGQLTPQRFAVPEPPKCGFNCIRGSKAQFGPDHSLWYITYQIFPPYKTELRRTTLAGATTVFPLPAGDINTSFAFDTAGNVWCTVNNAHTLADLEGFVSKVSATGEVTTYPMPQGGTPTSVTVAGDGTVWFFDAGTYAVATISADGKVTQYPIPSPASDVRIAQEQLIAASDHTLWFADPPAGVIGHVSATHTIRLAPLPDDSTPRHLVADADGGVWFLDPGHHAIGHLSAAEQLTWYPFKGLMRPQSSLTLAPDGAVWFTLDNQVGQITSSGTMKLFDIPTLNGNLGSIVVGADNHVWFAEWAGLIGELTP